MWMLLFSVLSNAAVAEVAPTVASFAGKYTCAVLNRNMPDQRPYYRLPVTVKIEGMTAKISFKEPNRGTVSFSGNLSQMASEDGFESKSGDFKQMISLQQTEFGRFLSLTHQEKEFHYAAVGCIKG